MVDAEETTDDDLSDSVASNGLPPNIFDDCEVAVLEKNGVAPLDEIALNEFVENKLLPAEIHKKLFRKLFRFLRMVFQLPFALSAVFGLQIETSLKIEPLSVEGVLETIAMLLETDVGAVAVTLLDVAFVAFPPNIAVLAKLKLAALGEAVEIAFGTEIGDAIDCSGNVFSAFVFVVSFNSDVNESPSEKENGELGVDEAVETV